MNKICKLPVLKIGIKNHNLRIYNKETVIKIINNFNLKLDTGYIFYGELMFKDSKNYSEISIDNISHKIERLYIDNNILYADIAMMLSENGVVAESMLESDLLVLRPRTFSSVDDGFIEFKELITFDLIRKENDSFYGLI